MLMYIFSEPMECEVGKSKMTPGHRGRVRTTQNDREESRVKGLNIHSGKHHVSRVLKDVTGLG